MTNKKLTEIKTNKDDMVAALEKVKRELPVMIQMASITAQIRKAHFDAHVKIGFTEEQALELCKSTSL